jgi:hypothetical protein
MFILDEISKKEAILFEQSSSKEILFYSYLTKRKQNKIEPNHSGEVENVCLSAFGNSNIDVTKEISQGLKAQPVKGFHFSTNIISLIAYSLKSDEIKNKYLTPFFNNSSLTNQFVITKIFENYSLLSNNKSTTTFDLLIDEVVVNKDFEKGKKLILDAFQQVSDLIELFVVRYSYEQIILQHPNSKIELNFNELSENLIHLISSTKRKINRNVNIVVLLFGVILIPSIPYLVNLKWDEWGLEPYITGITISLPLLSVLFVILFNSNPSWANFIKKFKVWLLERWFKRRNMDFNKIKKLIKYEDE